MSDPSHHIHSDDTGLSDWAVVSSQGDVVEPLGAKSQSESPEIQVSAGGDSISSDKKVAMSETVQPTSESIFGGETVKNLPADKLLKDDKLAPGQNLLPFETLPRDKNLPVDENSPRREQFKAGENLPISEKPFRSGNLMVGENLPGGENSLRDGNVMIGEHFPSGETLPSEENTSSLTSSEGSDIISLATTDSDTHGEGCLSSDTVTDTDTEPEFVCLETDLSTVDSLSEEGSSTSGSEVKDQTTSASSVGTTFTFLAQYGDLAETREQELLQHAMLCGTPSEHHTHETLQRHDGLQEDRTLSEQAAVEKEEEKDGCMGDSNTDSLMAESRHGERHVMESVMQASYSHLSGIMIAVLVILLVFGLGLWVGLWVEQSRQVETQVSQVKKLQRTQEKHSACVSRLSGLELQMHTTFKRERREHHEAMSSLHAKHQELAKQLQETRRHRDRILETRNMQDSTEDHQGETATEDPELKQRHKAKQKARPGPEDVDRLQQNLTQERQRADMWRHLYLSLREEREVNMNTSTCLDFILHSMNISVLTQYLSGWSGPEGRVDLASWLSRLSRLQDNVVQSLPRVWGELKTALRHTFTTFTSYSNQATRSWEKAEKKESTFKTKKGSNMYGKNSGSDEGYFEDEDVKVETEDGDYSEYEDITEDAEEDYFEDEGVKVESEDEDWVDEQYDYDEEFTEDDDVEKIPEEDDEEISISVDGLTEEERNINSEKPTHFRNKNSDREDDSNSDDKHASRWSGMMNRVLKKTGKVLSKIGKKMNKAWNEVQGASEKLWSEKSVISRAAAHVKNSVIKMSSKLHKKASRWFKKHPKGEKKKANKDHMPHPANKAEPKKKNNEKNNKIFKKVHKQDFRQNQKEMDSKQAQNFGKTLNQHQKYIQHDDAEYMNTFEDPQLNYPNRQDTLNMNKHNMKKHEAGERFDKESGDMKKKDRSDKPLQDNKERSKRSSTSVSQDLQDKAKKTSSEETQGVQRTGHLMSNDIIQNSNKEQSEKQPMKESTTPPDLHTMPTHQHSQSKTAAAKLKYNIQNRFQLLFSKVSSMNMEQFKTLSQDDVSKMYKRLQAVSAEYNDNIHLGLPLSGSRYLQCQCGFWFKANAVILPDCHRYLARWQTAEFKKKQTEATTADNDHTDFNKRNGLFYDLDFNDGYDFADDCQPWRRRHLNEELWDAMDRDISGRDVDSKVPPTEEREAADPTDALHNSNLNTEDTENNLLEQEHRSD